MKRIHDTAMPPAERARRARTKKAERLALAHSALVEILAISTDERVRRLALAGLDQSGAEIPPAPRHTYDRLRAIVEPVATMPVPSTEENER